MILVELYLRGFEQLLACIFHQEETKNNLLTFGQNNMRMILIKIDLTVKT